MKLGETVRVHGEDKSLDFTLKSIEGGEDWRYREVSLEVRDTLTDSYQQVRINYEGRSFEGFVTVFVCRRNQKPEIAMLAYQADRRYDIDWIRQDKTGTE